MSPVLTRAPFCLAILFTAATWSRADAQSHAPGEYFGPREIAVGESMRADARGALATTLNPAGVALGSELVIEGSFGHRADDNGNAVTLSACDATSAISGCYYYRYFAASPGVAGADDTARRRVHEGGVALARRITQRVTVGVSGKYFDYDSSFMDEGDTSGATLDAGLVVRPVDILAVGVAGYHLVGKDSPQYPRGVGAGVSVRPIPQLALSFDGAWNLEAPEGQSTGRYGGGAEYFLTAGGRQVGYPMRAGAVHDVGSDGTYVTAGLGVLSTKIGVDIGTRIQVSGGDELLILASLRVFGPRRIQGTDRYQ